MINLRFDIQLVNELKDILQELNNRESIQADVEAYFQNANVIDILLTEHELLNKNNQITIEDIKQLSTIHPHLYNNSLTEELKAQKNFPGHPVQIVIEENKALETVLNKTTLLFDAYEKEAHQKKEIITEINELLTQLGEFNKHYHRKEKLFFPMIERYGYLDPSKIMWKNDDRIRALYKALKAQIKLLPNLEFKHIRKTYDTFEKAFKGMIFQEEALILPVLQAILSEEDWAEIAEESSAFGYVFRDADEQSLSGISDKNKKSPIPTDKNIPFGGGYLTIEEANLILNNLPLEITFVDKNSVFKYFNKITNASEMMLVRTPISIGRNVANCHPPKSLSKVMTLVRDLKTKKRASESMWFKKGDEYIHLTYKALFNEQDEFIGILEYVQDIQGFLDLSTEIKRGLSKIDP